VVIAPLNRGIEASVASQAAGLTENGAAVVVVEPDKAVARFMGARDVIPPGRLQLRELGMPGRLEPRSESRLSGRDSCRRSSAEAGLPDASHAAAVQVYVLRTMMWIFRSLIRRAYAS
jgi:hypothetical protein